VKCDRLTFLLTEANKAIRHKELVLQQKDLKINELQRYIGLQKEVSLEGGKKMNLGEASKLVK